MSRAEDRELVETSEKLVSNSNVSLEMDENPIVLSAKEQRKMYPGRYMSSGELGGREVSVLRDTGCTFAVVKRSLLPPGDLTGAIQTYVLMDGTVRSAPIAKVEVTTSFYRGQLRAPAVENPIADVIIGNIDGVSGEHREESETACAVKTRSTAKKQSDDSDRVEDEAVVNIGGDQTAPLMDFSTAEIREAQRNDASLVKSWEKVDMEGP